MRLAYLSNVLPNLTETFIYREIFQLRDRGANVRTYSLRKPSPAHFSQEAFSIYSSTYYLLPVRLSTLLKAQLRFMVLSPVRYVRALWKMLEGTHNRAKDRVRSLLHFGEGVVLSDRMLSDGITHIHAHFASQSTSVARVVHLLTGISYSFTGHAHDIWHDRLLFPEKLLEARFAVTCSDMGRRHLLAQAGRDVSGKVHVVYHGLNVDSFPYVPGTEGRERNLILSVGRLTAQKGFPDLIKACSLLKGRGMAFMCTIVGQGEDRDELERLIKAEGLSECVVLAGAVPQEGIKEYYRRAWVFALPCVDTHDGNRDGIPNVLMEAMAMGVPVVTTANSGQPELIEDGIHGFLVPTHSPSALADALVKLCDDEALRQKITHRARKRMEEEFDSRKTTEGLLELFKQCIPGSKPEGQENPASQQIALG
jgi:glycosyltransferase involved in cell wall biosynthesis